jgi:shikimate dehydrogenase
MISGRTRIFAIIADPVAHVRTPQALNALFEREGQDAVIVPLQIAAADLETGVAGLRAMRNLGGLVVTVPHKSAVSVLCDTVSERARLAGAVNVVRKEADGALAGDLLDGEGFAAGLEQAGVALAGKRAFLAGAGGAASAIAFALAERGVARLTIANRSQDKAEALARRLAPLFPDLALSTEAGPEDHDIAINATSLGLKEGDPLPFDPARLPAGALVAEVVMQPDIKRMLDGQLDAICDFLTGGGQV